MPERPSITIRAAQLSLREVERDMQKKVEGKDCDDVVQTFRIAMLSVMHYCRERSVHSAQETLYMKDIHLSEYTEVVLRMMLEIHASQANQALSHRLGFSEDGKMESGTSETAPLLILSEPPQKLDDGLSMAA